MYEAVRHSVLPGWAKQTTEFMTSQSPGSKRYVQAHSAIHIHACLAYINQSIQQYKHL